MTLAITTVVGVAALALLARFSGHGPGWDDTTTMLLPAVALLLVAARIGRHRMQQPQDALLLPTRPAGRSADPLRIAGVVAVTLGVVLAVFGDTVLGYRRYTEVHNGIGYPAVEFPVVVARIWVLPYLGGLLTLIGCFLLINRRHDSWPHMTAAVAAGAATVWVAAATNPANHDAAAYLWFGLQPVLLLALTGMARRKVELPA